MQSELADRWGLLLMAAKMITQNIDPTTSLVGLGILIILVFLGFLTRGRLFRPLLVVVRGLGRVLVRIFRALRRIRRISKALRAGKVIRASRRVSARTRSYVGTTGIGVFKRLFSPRTETEKTIDKAILMAPRIDPVLDELASKYEAARAEARALAGKDRRELQIEPDFDKYIDDFLNREELIWKDCRNTYLEDTRREFFDLYREDISRVIRKRNIVTKKSESASEHSEIQFGDIIWDNLSDKDYEDIGGFIDEDHVLSEIATNMQKGKFQKHGLIFKEIDFDIDMTDSLQKSNKNEGRNIYLLASKCFKFDVPTDSDPQSLYEDVSDSAIVAMTGYADKDVYHYLTEMRKLVNRNVRILCILLPAFLAAYITANYWLSTSINFVGLPALIEKLSTLDDVAILEDALLESNNNVHKKYGYSVKSDASLFKNNVAEKNVQAIFERISGRNFMEKFENKSLFALLSFIIAWSLMAFYYRNPYTHYLNQNRVHLINFMITYTADILGSYRDEKVEAQETFNRGLSLSVVENTKVRFINMQWFAFRILFVETFLRSVLFQIRRNSDYYIVLLPFLIVLPIIAISWGIDALLPEFQHKLTWIDIAEWILVNMGFLIILWILSYEVCWRGFLRKSVVGFNIDDRSWRNFQSFDLQCNSSDLIRQYVSQIYVALRSQKPEIT